MNRISKTKLSDLGYNFIPPAYLPKGKNEYYLRDKQLGETKRYISLSKEQRDILIANGNSSDNWDNVLVDKDFSASLVKHSRFYGLVRIGKLEEVYLEFHDVRLPVGIYDSSIISCDLGDNVAISNVNYLSHYIIGSEVIIINCNEIEVSDHSKFGNGIIMEGEKESVRIWMELCNENGGRSVLLFDGMQTGDAYLWTRHRANKALMEKFRQFTEEKFDHRRGHYGFIGDRSVIKNTGIIKDTNIGTDAYIKGANKLKNLTINSSAESPTQIGEGCEMVNGIIGFGCRAFYGVKAVRFILASHSQLKYGARLINSFLGDNSTISCCEVLNSLIFPAHEQHHNNSFLCASVLMGQTNMAAGATIGSNHNSRGADGELIAGRGFWPGLCVSLKHNSKFASYILMAKGDFPAELNIKFPFSLVSNDVSNDKLVIMPAYWFMYNMYALARNSGKYEARDKRSFKNQYLEYDFLAPDSINDVFVALALIEEAAGKSSGAHSKLSSKKLRDAGKKLLRTKNGIGNKKLFVSDAENSTRKVELVKANEAYKIYRELIVYYGVLQIISYLETKNITAFQVFMDQAETASRTDWKNIGGQLMPAPAVDKLITSIVAGDITSWDEVHNFYHEQSDDYPRQKFLHAVASLFELLEITAKKFTNKKLVDLLKSALATRRWMVENIQESRAKDYDNPFRTMVYDSKEEMEQVIGKLEDNPFILDQREGLEIFSNKINTMIKAFEK